MLFLIKLIFLLHSMNSITFPCVGKESYQLTSQLKVREIFSFASRHIFPNLRLAEVTTELYYSRFSGHQNTRNMFLA
jgi:hypothetical protein